MAGPSAHERVKKLESRGVIRGYAAAIDPAAVGLNVLAFTWVRQAPGTVSVDLTPQFATIAEIEECHYITGEADYLLKIRARDMAHLGDVVRHVQTTEHVFTTETDVVFTTGFEGRPLPVSAAPAPETGPGGSAYRMTERRVADDEAVLVRAVAGGSEDALASLYDRHVGGVHAVAIRLTGDRGIAEEVVQETFLALWNRAELFDPASRRSAPGCGRSPGTGRLTGCVPPGRRPILASLPGGAGRGRPDERGLDRLGRDAAVIGGAGRDPDPEAAAEAASVRAAIGAALATMPEVERTVIVLAYREGLTQQEIAQRLDWPLGTVKTQDPAGAGAPAGAARVRRRGHGGRRPRARGSPWTTLRRWSASSSRRRSRRASSG